MSLLVIGATATVGLVAWSLYIRSTAIDERAFRRAGLRSGLELAARLDTEYLAVLGALGALALALAYAMWQRRRWTYITAAFASAATIAGVWYGRSVVVRLEDPHFVKKSPWVKAATLVATVATIYLALVIVSSVIAWFAQRKRPT